MKRLLTIPVLYIWQLPQVLLGYAILLYFRLGKHPDRHVLTTPDGVQVWASKGMRGAISLGMLTVHGPSVLSPADIRHELGHTQQSRLLGPLYLLIVGIPSLVHAWHWRPSKGDYFAFWTERWANRLGERYFSRTSLNQRGTR